MKYDNSTQTVGNQIKSTKVVVLQSIQREAGDSQIDPKSNMISFNALTYISVF